MNFYSVIAIWDLGNLEMKQLLIGVLFSDKIYYTKNEEFQTPHLPLIYNILNHCGTDNKPMGNFIALSVTDFLFISSCFFIGEYLKK